MAELETPIRNDCLDWLNKQPHIWAWRRNVAAMRVAQKKGPPRWIQFGQKGQVDLEGIVTVRVGDDDIGVHLEVEVKTPGRGKRSLPTPNQAAYLVAASTRGAIALWCDSVSMLEYKLKQEFQRRGWEWPSAG